MRPGPTGQTAPAGECQIWGTLNVTPDSFSDGGRYLEPGPALARAERMVADGATVVDVGGESSRPAGNTYGEGFEHVPADEELRRVLPVVSALVERGVRVSVDTVKAEVASACLDAGASIINDVSGGASEGLLRAVAEADAELVLMHTRGKGEVRPPFSVYGEVVDDVASELLRAADRAVASGVAPERLWLDPGIGFAKTAEQSLRLLAGLPKLVALGMPVLVGASRKSFIAETAPAADGQRPPPLERLGGTLVSAVVAARAGARAVRVHDVAQTWQALSMWRALAQEGAP